MVPSSSARSGLADALDTAVRRAVEIAVAVRAGGAPATVRPTAIRVTLVVVRRAVFAVGMTESVREAEVTEWAYVGPARQPRAVWVRKICKAITIIIYGVGAARFVRRDRHAASCRAGSCRARDVRGVGEPAVLLGPHAVPVGRAAAYRGVAIARRIRRHVSQRGEVHAVEAALHLVTVFDCRVVCPGEIDRGITRCGREPGGASG